MSTGFRRFSAVIRALIIREAATRYGRSFGGYAWAFIEPTLIIVVLGYIFHSYFGEPPLGNSFALFYCTGLVPFVVFSEIAGQTGNALIQNKPLLNLRPVTPIDTIVSRFILSFCTLGFVSLVVFCLVLGLTDEPYMIAWAPLVAGILGAAFLGLGVGSVNAVLFAVLPTWRNIWNIVHRPLFLISGIFFLYERLPLELQSVIFWNPLLHSISLTRAGFYEQYDPSWVALSFMFGIGLLGMITASISLLALGNRVVENL